MDHLIWKGDDFFSPSFAYISIEFSFFLIYRFRMQILYILTYGVNIDFLLLCLLSLNFVYDVLYPSLSV